MTLISLIISGVEHLFMCLLIICLLWRNVYLYQLTILLLGYLVFYTLSFIRCLFILEINPTSVALFANIFFHCKSVFLLCLWFPLLCKNFKLNYVPFAYFHYSRRWLKKDLAVIYVQECSSYVSL